MPCKNLAIIYLANPNREIASDSLLRYPTMPLYVARYDLRCRKDDQLLSDEISRLDAHKQVQSVDFLNVDTNLMPAPRDHLAGFIDDDKSIVIEFYKKPAHQNPIRAPKNIRDNL